MAVEGRKKFSCHERDIPKGGGDLRDITSLSDFADPNDLELDFDQQDVEAREALQSLWVENPDLRSLIQTRIRCNF